MIRDAVTGISLSAVSVRHIGVLAQAGASIGRIAYVYGFDGNEGGALILRLLRLHDAEDDGA